MRSGPSYRIAGLKPYMHNYMRVNSMKTNILVFLFIGVVAAPVLADKPEWAGKGKPTVEQKEAHRNAMEAKGGMEDERGNGKEKIKKEKKDQSDKLKGVEKQTDKKAGQVQKESGKGSEKGMESRETSRKWWKFWGE